MKSNFNYSPFGYRREHISNGSEFQRSCFVPFADLSSRSNEVTVRNANVTRSNAAMTCASNYLPAFDNQFNPQITNGTQRRALLPTPIPNQWNFATAVNNYSQQLTPIATNLMQWQTTINPFIAHSPTLGMQPQHLETSSAISSLSTADNKPVSDAQTMNEVLNTTKEELSPYQERDFEALDLDVETPLDMVISDSDHSMDGIDYEKLLDEALNESKSNAGNKESFINTNPIVKETSSTKSPEKAKNKSFFGKKFDSKKSILNYNRSNRKVEFRRKMSSPSKTQKCKKKSQKSRHKDNLKKKVKRKVKGSKHRSLIVEINSKSSTPERVSEAEIREEKNELSTYEVKADENEPISDISLENLENASFEELMDHYKKIQHQLKELAVEEKSRGILEQENCTAEEKKNKENEEDDEDLLELRRLALISTKAKSQTKEETKPEDENTSASTQKDDSDPDEIALREMLLKSLKQRKNDKSTFSEENSEKQSVASEKLNIVVDMIVEKIDSPSAEFEVKQPFKEKSNTSIVNKFVTSNTSNITTESIIKRPVQNKPLALLDLMPKEKIIIHFGEDSSDEGEEEENNVKSLTVPPLSELDSLLKEARSKATVETKTSDSKPKIFRKNNAVNKLSVAQQEEYQKLKAEIARREQNGVEKENLLTIKESKWRDLRLKFEQKKECMNDLKSKVIQKRIQLRRAQLHARKIQEMYIAATRVVASHAAELNKFNGELKSTENEIKVCEKFLSSLENECRTIGKVVKGNDYALPTIVAKKQNDESSVIQARKRLKSETDNKHKSNKELAAEKKRLQELESIVTEKLRNLKGSPALISALKKKESEVNVNADKIKDKEKPKHLVEKMKRFSKALSQNVSKHLKKPCLTKASIPFDYFLHFVTHPSQLLIRCSVTELKMPIQTKVNEAQLKIPQKENFVKDHDSVLFHLHSFRLSDCFEEYAKKHSQSLDFTSPVYSNAINPYEYLCRFDLIGMCNDDKCTWQHKKHYSLTVNEKLVDLLSYKPSIAGVTDEEENGSQNQLQKIQEFIANLKQKNPDLNEKELSYEILKMIRSSIEKDNSVCTLTRTIQRFKAKTISCSSVHTFDDFKYCIKIRDRLLILTYGKVFRIKADIDPDNCIKNRFFAPEGRPLSAELETTLASDPGNIQLWVKLAYYHVTRDPNRKSDCIIRALNVLSRSLDFNPMNAELWEHFLFLYANRNVSSDQDSKSSILTICEKAVSVCPHFKTWKLYLSYCISFTDKERVSSQFLAALCNRSVLYDENSSLSHCLLNIVIYKVRLYIETGQRKKAEEFLKNSLIGENQFPDCKYSSSHEMLETVLSGSDSQTFNENAIGHLLNVDDRVFAWLCFIYLYYFKTQPFDNFDVLRQSFSEITNKKPFIFAWQENIPITNKMKEILVIFKTALDQCFDRSSNENVEHILPFIVNIACLEFFCLSKSGDEVLKIYDRLIQLFPECTKLRILKAEFMMQCLLTDGALGTLESFSPNFDLNATYLIASIYFELEDYVKCREILRKVINCYYNVEIEESEMFLAYRCLMVNEDTEDIHSEYFRSAFKYENPTKPTKLWLCYLLLQLIENRQDSEVESSFQTAISLCKLNESSETEFNLLWWLYVNS
ncbi:zinc finger C3H1 domain-containing protein-like protein [Dinothrombium tinctorium]|uniref:Zinc finger C3H1 domain-containing protein-like protein n=1 Tax=Dinothrombium tinctorium TaxID=1965070 RepID=A0A3S3P9T0_9ACAR|nr:zinc finger C3H1 domain-containing protein-like protein [Dinothrombium tinctorium]